MNLHMHGISFCESYLRIFVNIYYHTLVTWRAKASGFHPISVWNRMNHSMDQKIPLGNVERANKLLTLVRVSITAYIAFDS
jgi:hypothetical protein